MRGSRAYARVALLVLLGALWTFANRLPAVGAAESALTAAPQRNFHAPAFALASVTGETYELSALNGKVVLVNFWATWCPPCRAEMPALDAVYRAKQDAGLVVLAVNEHEDATTVKSFGERFNLSFPLLLNTDGALTVLYRIQALPTTFFIDRRGIIRDVVFGGPMSRELIESKVNPLLEESANR